MRTNKPQVYRSSILGHPWIASTPEGGGERRLTLHDTWEGAMDAVRRWHERPAWARPDRMTAREASEGVRRLARIGTTLPTTTRTKTPVRPDLTHSAEQEPTDDR